MLLFRNIVVIGLAIMVLGCSGGKHVSQHDYKDVWPFIVESGSIECLNENEVVFTHNGDNYALNAKAIRSGKYLSVESMRKRNPPPSNTKMSLKEMTRIGLKECRE